MYRKFKILVLLTLVLVSACNIPDAPEFRRVENLKIDLLNKDGAKIEGDAIFYNPNEKRVIIKGVKLDVAVEDQKVASVDRKYDIRAEGLNEFTVPVDVDVSLKDLNMDMLTTALSLIGGNKKKVHYKGKVKVKVYGFNYNIPIDYAEEVKFEL